MAKKVVSPKKKNNESQQKPPIPIDGWLKLWLRIVDKELDNFHEEDFKQDFEK